MRGNFHHATLFIFAAVLLAAVTAHGQTTTYTQHFALGNGTFYYTTQQVANLYNCDDDNMNVNYTVYFYSNLYYKDAFGGTQYFSDNADYSEAWNCQPYTAGYPAGGNPPTIQLNGTDSQGNDYQINLSVNDGGLTGTYESSGILYPQYQIQSIIYSAPGNGSSNGYTNSATNGIVTTVGSNFTQGSSLTFSASGGFFGIGSTLSWTYGQSSTTGDSTATTSSIMNATGVANASSSSSSNAINHLEDLFIVWLNPAVQITQTGTSAATYTLETQVQPAGYPSPGQPEELDQVEVFAHDMIGTGGVTTVPVQELDPQIINGQVLPGLGAICANNSLYAQQLAADLANLSNPAQICTQSNQCGCQPADFSNIVAADPLINYAPTTSPLNADTSGAACTNPASSAKCRYVPIMVSSGSTVQQTELLAGPSFSGGNTPRNTFTQTDSTSTTKTLNESLSTTMSFSWLNTWKPLGTGIGLSKTKTWTWTNSESTGKMNGIANSMSVTFSSNTVDCFENIPIFEDTVYHTFVFQQPSGNSSCP